MDSTDTLERLRASVTAKLGALHPYRLGFIAAIDTAISERDRARSELATLRRRIAGARRLILDGLPLPGDQMNPVFQQWMRSAQAWLAEGSNHGR